MKLKVQRKVEKHFRELRCDWCNQYNILPTWKETPANEKMLAKWKEKFLAPTGTQDVLYECKRSTCVRSRPEGWDDKWCYKCRKYGTCTHEKM